MIAGTTFNLCRPPEVWSRLVNRISRTNDAMQVLYQACDAATNEDAIWMLCSDGLVVMTLRGRADGTIVAVVLMAASFGEIHAFKRQQDDMMTVARDAGATRLEFYSDRKVWSRMLGPEWNRNGDTYSRSL